jgi:predicted MFS family arabinose efflux permease
MESSIAQAGEGEVNTTLPGLALSRAAVIATAMVFGVTSSLMLTLIALDLSRRGFDGAVIGLNTAVHAGGVVAMAPFVPRLVVRFTLRGLVLGAILVAAATMIAFPFLPSVALWFPARFILGAASEVMFAVSETWVTRLAGNANRGRMMAIYTASITLGLALGPACVALVGSRGAEPYFFGAALVLPAALLMLMPGLLVPRFEHSTSGSDLRFLRKAPIAMLTPILIAGLQTAGLSFLPLYAMSAGWPLHQAALFDTVLLIGAIVLQLPIGWLSDKIEPRRMMIFLALLSGISPLTWPFLLATPWMAFLAIFIWGGLFVGLYTVCLSLVGKHFKGSDLVAVLAMMGFTWGIGGCIGPVVMGVAVNLFGHGLPFVVAASCLIFTVFLHMTKSEA